MDLFRFFHPHHNPRLKNKRLRLQELSELELAIKEIQRALVRANVRQTSSNATVASEYIKSSKEAIELALSLISQCIEEYPEDSDQDLYDLLSERKSAPGWEAWTRLLSEKLKSITDGSLTPIHYAHEEIVSPPEMAHEHPQRSIELKIKA